MVVAVHREGVGGLRAQLDAQTVGEVATQHVETLVRALEVADDQRADAWPGRSTRLVAGRQCIRAEHDPRFTSQTEACSRVRAFIRQHRRRRPAARKRTPS